MTSPGPNYRADIGMIDLSADAGVAILVEPDYLGTDFVDYFGRPHGGSLVDHQQDIRPHGVVAGWL
ncbi:MAG TPA: hypothetical protein VGF80_12490 [Galbitalea sp.]|jgi:hypothetical protein